MEATVVYLSIMFYVTPSDKHRHAVGVDYET